MDKEHSKQFKKARTLLKRKSYSIGKIDRKLKKKKNDLELINLKKIAAIDFQTELRRLCDHERLSVREVVSNEMSLYQVHISYWTTASYCSKVSHVQGGGADGGSSGEH